MTEPPLTPPPHPDGPDNAFNDDEIVYRRLDALGEVGGRVQPGALRFPDCSVDRSKYREAPADVLDLEEKPHENGVAMIPIAQIPPRETSGNGKQTYEVYVAHDPRVGNYAHSEIRVVREGEEWVRGAQVMSKAARKSLRQRIADNMTVVIQPATI